VNLVIDPAYGVSAERSMLGRHRPRLHLCPKAVEISFKNAKLAQMLNEEAQLVKAFDARTARQIRLRLAVLAASPTLADVPVRPPEGRHQLKGNPEQHFAVYVEAPCRIVFEPATPAPKTANGRLDLRKVSAITILDIVHKV
jgi:proteic killer suppression protein